MPQADLNIIPAVGKCTLMSPDDITALIFGRKLP